MQSIIVYRNPIEAAFWESMMNGGAIVFFAVIAIALAGVAIYALLENAASKIRYRRRMFRTHGTNGVGRVTEVIERMITWMAEHSGKVSITVVIVLLIVAHNIYAG